MLDLACFSWLIAMIVVILALARLFRWAFSGVVSIISVPIIRSGNSVTRTTCYTFTTHPGPVWAVTWSPNGAYLAATEETRVRIWRVATGREVFSYRGHTGDVRVVAWSPTKPFLLVSGGRDCSIHRWRFHPFTNRMQSFGRNVEAEPLGVAWSPMKDAFIGAGNRSMMLFTGVWPLIDSTMLGVIHPTPIRFIAWSSDGRYLASAGHGGTVYLWKIGCDRPVIAPVSNSVVTSLAFSPDSRGLVVSYADGVVRVWTLHPLLGLVAMRLANTRSTTLNPIRSYHEHVGKVHAATWSPDSRKVASGGDDTILRIWNVLTGVTFLTYTTKSPILSLSWSPNGKQIAIGLQSLPLQIIRVPS